MAAKVVIAYLDCLLAGAGVVTIGPKRARLIRAVAMATKLRAADAKYAWLARNENVTLVTLDRELLELDASGYAVEPP